MDEKPVRRRDDEGRWQAARSWESLIDRQIREAMDEGKFDDLPHRGAPLPNDENPHAREWGLAFHMLKNSGYAPPWIEADKEVRELLERRDALHAAILRLNSEAPGPRQQRRSLVLADELARYDELAG